MTSEDKKLIASRIFIISGPSGAGEDSIIEGLAEQLEVERVITTTSRAMRPRDSEGDPYYFISKEEFLKKIEQHEFVEYALEYNDNYYGVTEAELLRVASSGKIGLWKIEYKGVITAQKLFPGIVSILISAPLKDLEIRIKLRDGVSDEYIAERMAYTKKWLEYRHIYDFEVLNEHQQLKRSIQEVKQIILDKQSF